jgi:hypothetical protein
VMGRFLTIAIIINELRGLVFVAAYLGAFT